MPSRSVGAHRSDGGDEDRALRQLALDVHLQAAQGGLVICTARTANGSKITVSTHKERQLMTANARDVDRRRQRAARQREEPEELRPRPLRDAALRFSGFLLSMTAAAV
jgi:hypothetical protein